MYTAFKAANPDFKFDEQQIGSCGFGLVWSQHFPEAIAILSSTPSSSQIRHTFTTTSQQAYARNGQKDLAIASYEKALAIQPHDPVAKAELEKSKNSTNEKP